MNNSSNFLLLRERRLKRKEKHVSWTLKTIDNSLNFSISKKKKMLRTSTCIN